MNIILLGPPGAGKGTQAKRVAGEMSAAHVASGDLFRKHLSEGTELGLLAKGYMNKGELVPDDVTIRMVLERCAEPDASKGVVLDGFPRTVVQANALDEALDANGARIDLALLIECDYDEIRRRLLGRAEEEGRADDSPDVIEARFETYEAQTAPLVDFYEGQGKLRRVNGDQSIQGVTDDLLAAVGDASPLG